MAELTREELYELVWAEPMLKVAARYDVSSSYLARICSLLNVPRPERGYWAKLAVGKAPAKPALPEARPGDPIEWSRDGHPARASRELPRPPAPAARKRRPTGPRPATHPLIAGAKILFETRSYWSTSSYPGVVSTKRFSLQVSCSCLLRPKATVS